MDTFIQFLLLGIGTGAVYAGIGLGLVLAYQGSGVINFAHGAMMMYCTYIYDELRDSGDYVFPVSIAGNDRVNVLGQIPDGGSHGFWMPFLLGMATAALLGLLAHFLVFRPLRDAPLLAKVVATVGMFVVLSAVVLLRFGTQLETVRGILPSSSTDVLGTTIPQDRLWLLLIVVLTAIGLAALYKLTSFGLATRAAAEDEKGAILLGFSPQTLAAGNWVLSSMVAAAFGILFAPLSSGVNTISYTQLVVPALAVALVGGLRSFLLTAAAGLALGMLQSEIFNFQTKSWWPDWALGQGVQQALPFLVIVLVLFFMGKSLPTRGTLDEGRQAFAPDPRNVVRATVVLVGAGTVMILLFDRALRLSLYQSMIAMIIVLSIVVLTGYIGQVSLAQAAFAGMAGFVLGKVAAAGVAFPIAPLLGALGAAVLGIAVGVPALRIRGIQLAVITMALGVAVEVFVFKNTEFIGITGVLPIEKPELFGIDLAADLPPEFARETFGFLLLSVLTLAALATVNLRRSPTGRRFIAVRANERAAAACGVSVAETKLVGFGLSSFLAGLGGGMLAYLTSQLSGDSFSVLFSLSLLAFAYLGGIGLVSGAIIAGIIAPGGLLAGLLDKAFDSETLNTYFNLIGGLGLILTAILNPDGIAGKTARDLAAARAKKARKEAEAVSATGTRTEIAPTGS